MKKLFLIVGAVVVIIIILLVVGVSNLGPIVKTAVNTYGPKITKTEVSLSDVSVSIFSGEVKLKDFYLGNPKGFKSVHAMSVGSIYVDVDEGSLTGDTIIIDKIEIAGPEITYEKSGSTDNFKALLDNVKRTTATDNSREKKTSDDVDGKKILIRNFIVKGGKVNLAASILGGKSVSTSLPDIHLKDLGKEENGISPADAFKVIFAALHKNITSQAVTDALKENLNAQTEALKAAGEDARKQAEGVKEDLKSNLDAISEEAKGLFGK